MYNSLKDGLSWLSLIILDSYQLFLHNGSLGTANECNLIKVYVAAHSAREKRSPRHETLSRLLEAHVYNRPSAALTQPM